MSDPTPWLEDPERAAQPAAAARGTQTASVPMPPPPPVPSGALPTPAVPLPAGETIVSSPLAERLIDWTPLFSGHVLADDARQLLNSLVGLRAFRQGAAIFRQGQMATHLYAVCQGTAGLGRNRLGRADVLMQSFQLRRPVSPGQWLDLHTAWLGQAHDLDACALTTPTVVLEWPLHLARDFLASRCAPALSLLQAMAGQVRLCNSDLHDVLSKDALRRVAAWLMRCAGAHTVFQMQERKRDVAAQLSVSPETFSRMMRQLEKRGLVQVDGYHITLLDRIALIRLTGDT
ncbi:Crp/Fnr family transcriptional regulator [Roseateles depolymerans]|nr:Crp/Fnr family transcriptional regulator [Roseateles depolymerans]